MNKKRWIKNYFMHRSMLSIDYFLCWENLNSTKTTLEYVCNDLIDWWGRNMFNNLLHSIAHWLRSELGRENVLVPDESASSTDTFLWTWKMSECWVNFNEKLHVISKRVCRQENPLNFHFHKNLSRTQLWRRQILNYMLNINL